jgi:transposase InsO family protein
MSTGRPIIQLHDQEEMAKMENQIRRINGTDGTQELVNIALTGAAKKPEFNFPTSEEEWVIDQSNDDWCKQLLEKLKGSQRILVRENEEIEQDKNDYYFKSPAGVLKRRTNKLIKKIHAATEISVLRKIDQIIVPKKNRAACLYLLHDQLGHPGRERTLKTMQEHYQWIGIAEDVKFYTHNCRFCKLRKVDNFRAKVPIQEYNMMGLPFDRVHADLAGPFLPTEEGKNTYILIIKDALTKFVILTPLKGKSMDVVTDAFTRVVLSNFGPPKLLITDKGTDFVNKNLKHWCKVLGVNKKNTTPANPRSDGLAENAVKTVKDMLTSYISVYQTNWDIYLPIIQYDYNTTINDATGFDPYFLLFGRTANRIGENEADNELLDIVKPSEYSQQFTEVMRWVWKYAAQRVVENSKSMKTRQHPVSHLEFKEYEVGDFFYQKRISKRFYKNDADEVIHKLNAKLQYRWTGPYIITKKLSPVVYEADVHNKKKIVHAVNMRRF